MNEKERKEFANELEIPYDVHDDGSLDADDQRELAYQDWTKRIPKKETMLKEFVKSSCRRFYSFIKSEYGYDKELALRKAEKLLGLPDNELTSMTVILKDAEMRKDLNVAIWKEKEKVLFS